MTPLTVHLMTAGLTPGDAISNNILSVRRILRKWGAAVRIYADSIAPAYAPIAEPSSYYQDTGQALLWFHYSIYSDNVEIALASQDYKIMDYHGICPPHLFKGYNAHLEFLCQSGVDLTPSLNDKFDAFVVHSEFTRKELLSLGFPADTIHKIALCVDRTEFAGTADGELARLLERLDYFLFVGRIIPQKDILKLIEIFALVNRRRPDTVLVLVGTRQQAARYQSQIDRLIADRDLAGRVMITGQVNNPAVLAALYSHARLLMVTSEWESFCVPIAEALFFGKPTVVHHIPPMPEVAGPAGLVVDKNDPRQAAEKVLELLDDDVRYRQLQEEAHAWAQQYTDRALANNILRLFSALFGVLL